MLYEDTPDRKKIVVQDYMDMVTEATEGIKEYFHTMPKAPVTVIAAPEYSEKTAPYNKCLEFTAPTDVIVTKEEAPPENNWSKTIWEAPPNIIIDIPNVMYALRPNSIPITPKMIPNGTTGIIKGLTSIIPLDKVLDLSFILS